MSSAVVASASSAISASTPNKSAIIASSSSPRPRTKRVFKRRGPAARRLDDGSDDEIEREARSDGSASDSDLLDDSDEDEEESAEEENASSDRVTQVKGVGVNGHEQNVLVHANGHADASSARPGSVSDGEGGSGDAKPEPPRSAPAFLSGGMDWSEMVADEGAGTVPVIDFGDLGEHADPGTGENQAGKSNDGVVSVQKRDENGDGDASSTVDSSRSTQIQRTPRGGASINGAPRLPTGQTVRQAYQERLQADPAFVPVVGEFWGHDDRLMRKEFRSLSGWWRGKWQGRGRGGFAGRGGWRGRGGFMGGPPSMNGARPVEGKDEEGQGRSPALDVPPIEKEWTHDGFEEMKAKEERLKVTRQQQDFQRGGKVGGRGLASRGAFVPRGRGSAPVGRGAALSPASTRRMPFKADPDRPWFTEKPENIWTKQHESYLPTLRQKHVNAPTIRLRLPGKDSKLTKVLTKTSEAQSVDTPTAQTSQSPSVTSTNVSKTITINLPKGQSAEDETDSIPPVVPLEPIVPVDNAVDNTLLVESISEPPPDPPAQDSSFPSLNGVTATPSLTRDNSVSDRSVTDGHVAPEPASVPPPVLSLDDGKPAQDAGPIAGPIPPIITGSFIPPVQPTPQYAASPYTYATPLPPGIAVNQQGYAYDFTSGRPVYMHPTPPPMPMFNPRPMPYGHMHHHSHSISGDFMQASSPPLSGFVDPSTGQPLFAPPRQSARLEIRAPTEGMEVRQVKERRPSNLRSSTTTIPSVVTNGSDHTSSPQLSSHSSSHVQSQAHITAPSNLARFASAPEYYPSDPTIMRAYPSSSENGLAVSPSLEDGHGAMMGHAAMDPGMMSYNPYQQQYFYPEQYYGTYMELPPGAGQYDPYAVDPRHQQAVYYH